MGDFNTEEDPGTVCHLVLESPLEKPRSKDSIDNGQNDNNADSHGSVPARTDHDQATASSDDQRSSNSKRSSTPEPEYGPDGQEIFYVEKILKKKILKTGQPLYFVKWKNYSDKYNTWEPPSSFNSSSVITQYEKKLQREIKKKTERGRKRYVMARDPDPDYDELPKYLKNKRSHRDINGESRSVSTEAEKVIPPRLSPNVTDVSTAPTETTHVTVKVEESSILTETVQDQLVKPEECPITDSSKEPLTETKKDAVDHTDASEIHSGQPESDSRFTGCVELSADDLERIEQRKRNYQKCAKKSVGKADRKAKPVTNHPLHKTTKESGVDLVPIPKKVSKIEALLLVKKKKADVDLEPLPLMANIQTNKIAKVLPVPIKKKPKTTAHHPELPPLPERIYVSDDSSEEEYPNEEDNNTTEFTVIKDGTQSIVFEESRSRFGVFKNPSAQR